jgi:ribosomal protein L39E
VDLAKRKEENRALGEKLKDAEQKAQIAKNEVKNAHIPIFIKCTYKEAGNYTGIA